MLEPGFLPFGPPESRDGGDFLALFQLGAPHFDKQNEGGVRSTLLTL